MRGRLPAILLAVLVTALCPATVFGAENFTPDQIKEGLPGKTKQEVKEMLGPPTAVSSLERSSTESDETGQWHYSHSTGYQGKAPLVLKGGRIIFDPVAEKAAAQLQVEFKGGAVSRVRLTY